MVTVEVLVRDLTCARRGPDHLPLRDGNPHARNQSELGESPLGHEGSLTNPKPYRECTTAETQVSRELAREQFVSCTTIVVVCFFFFEPDRAEGSADDLGEFIKRLQGEDPETRVLKKITRDVNLVPGLRSADPEGLVHYRSSLHPWA